MSSLEFGKLEVNTEKSIRETDEEIVVPAILERESILKYDDGMGYRSAEELQKAAWLLNGTPILLYRHAWPIWNFSQEDVKGQVWDITWEAERAALFGDLHFRKAACDAELLEKIRSGGLSKDTSTAYRYMHDNTPGVFGGQPFDYQQRGFVFAHVAVGVPEGRCPGPYLGMLENSSDFLRVCLKPQGLFRSIATVMVSAKEGVYAVVGKLRDGAKETVTSEFVFDRELGWTDELAAEYVKEHMNSVSAPLGGQPKNDQERFMAHFGVSADVFQKLYDVSGDELFKLLPDRGQKIQRSKNEAKDSALPKLDPYEEIEKSRRLLGSR